MKMVIADDEVLERKALSKLMQSHMPMIEIVGEAINGRKAIQLADELKPDLFLMDIKMPGIDGVEAVKEIKKRHAHMKFIMISAFDTFAYAKDVMQQGVKEYILKPGRTEEILAAVQRVEKEWMEERHVNQILQTLKKHATPDPFEPSRLHPIWKAKEFIDSHYVTSITLEEAAEHAGMSAFHFSKQFKETVGATFIDYITDLRIERAKQEIIHSNKSLKEICFTCGYKDPNYFSRVFKKWTGYSPSEYRMR